MRFDVLVVGAGPGGATASYILAKSGAKVLTVDFKREVGSPVQCAEFVPVQISYSFPEYFTEKGIAQKVRDMLHFTPWGELISMPSEGFVLNRRFFDRRIMELACREGAQLMLRTRFVSFDGNKAVLENIETRQKFKVEADIIVASDGARSKIAKLTGEHTRSFLTTAQFTMPLTKGVDDLLIFFRDYIPGGYGWIFPKGDLANVGVGVDPFYGVKVTEVLRKFAEEIYSEGWVEFRIVDRTGGWIPAEGIKSPLRGRVLLVGDAGGFCHPITGGGIANAIITGRMAAEAIVEGELEEYEEESLDTFGDSINRAAEKRRSLMKSWDNLDYIIPRTWIAFEEYWY
jgi:geranylgeranyl reductase family protein